MLCRLLNKILCVYYNVFQVPDPGIDLGTLHLSAQWSSGRVQST